jgi:hypothetical protein
MVRRAQEQMNESDAVDVTNTATEVITRLNEGRMSHIDVRFINVAIEKTREYLKTDTVLSKAQREQARKLGEIIQNKLAGINAKRTVLDA